MTLAEMRALMAVGVNRADLGLPSGTPANAGYDRFINAALRIIQTDRSWDCQQAKVTVTIDAGESSTALPDDFKELWMPDMSAGSVYVVLPDNSPKPVQIVTEQQELRRYWALDAVLQPEFRMFIQDIPGDKSLNIISKQAETMSFIVHYYKFLADLVADSDSNWFTENEWGMVLEKAKQQAFMSINDPQADACEANYIKRFTSNARQESYSRTRGHKMRL